MLLRPLHILQKYQMMACGRRHVTHAVCQSARYPGERRGAICYLRHGSNMKEAVWWLPWALMVLGFARGLDGEERLENWRISDKRRDDERGEGEMVETAVTKGTRRFCVGRLTTGAGASWTRCSWLLRRRRRRVRWSGYLRPRAPLRGQRPWRAPGVGNGERCLWWNGKGVR